MPDTTNSVTHSPRHPVIISAAVRDAAHNAAEVALTLLGVPEAIAAAILCSTLVDDVLVEAFAAARVEVTAETAAIVDDRP